MWRAEPPNGARNGSIFGTRAPFCWLQVPGSHDQGYSILSARRRFPSSAARFSGCAGGEPGRLCHSGILPADHSSRQPCRTLRKSCHGDRMRCFSNRKSCLGGWMACQIARMRCTNRPDAMFGVADTMHACADVMSSGPEVMFERAFALYGSSGSHVGSIGNSVFSPNCAEGRAHLLAGPARVVGAIAKRDFRIGTPANIPHHAGLETRATASALATAGNRFRQMPEPGGRLKLSGQGGRRGDAGKRGGGLVYSDCQKLIPDRALGSAPAVPLRRPGDRRSLAQACLRKR